MAFVVFLMLVCSLVLAMITINLTTSEQAAKTRSSRFTGVPSVDAGMAKYQAALQSDDVDIASGYRMSRHVMQKMRGSSLSAVIPNSALTSGAYASFAGLRLNSTHMTGVYAYTMRDPTPGASTSSGEYSFWQVYGVHPPDFASGGSSSDLVVYFRGWEAQRHGSKFDPPSTPRIVRSVFRPGRFSDYQFLVDGPINFGTGGHIDGNVHSNGFPDALFSWPYPGVSIHLSGTNGNADCQTGASFSTASGNIYTGTSNCGRSSVPRRRDTGEVYNFLRVEDTYTLLRSRCGTGIVVCVSGSPSAPVPNTVRFSGSGVYVNGSYHSAFGGLAVLTSGNTRVSGTLTSGAVTVAAQNLGQSYGAASLILAGPGTVGASGSHAVVGLIAEGDIVLSLGQTLRGSGMSFPCVSGVDAAMVAESGAMTIPTQYRVPIVNAPGLLCPSLRLHGSLSAHLGMVTSLGTATTTKVGFRNRYFDYDKTLLANAPPYFPLTGPWSVTSFSDANFKCLTGSGWANVNCS